MGILRFSDNSKIQNSMLAGRIWLASLMSGSQIRRELRWLTLSQWRPCWCDHHKSSIYGKRGLIKPKVQNKQFIIRTDLLTNGTKEFTQFELLLDFNQFVQRATVLIKAVVCKYTLSCILSQFRIKCWTQYVHKLQALFRGLFMGVVLFLKTNYTSKY